MHREWLSFSFYFLPWSGLESYSISHLCNIGKIFFLWLFYFELLQNLDKVCTYWKNLSSILIYLNRSWCSICKQLHRGLSLKNFLFKYPFMLSRNSISFPINNVIHILLGIVARKTKKILRTRNDLSMEMHSNEGESVSTYPRRP